MNHICTTCHKEYDCKYGECDLKEDDLNYCTDACRDDDFSRNATELREIEDHKSKMRITHNLFY